ncbi:MAG: carbonic anhydrase [Candidatus Micrarchaeia archaeon]
MADMIGPQSREELLEKLKEGQNPPLVAIYCSDSRVDINLLGANPGEVFAIENAGNVFGLGDESKSSLAYALTHFSVDGKLAILVLGHTKCGAVTTACKLFSNGGKLDGVHPSIAGLMRYIFPSVERASTVSGDLVENAIIENTKAQMAHVRDFVVSTTGVKAGNVDVYGAIYEISAHDDILPAAWHLNAISKGIANQNTRIEEIKLSRVDGSYMRDLLNKMGLENFISMRQLPRLGPSHR